MINRNANADLDQVQSLIREDRLIENEVDLLSTDKTPVKSVIITAE